MRRDDEPARDRVGHSSTVVLAHDVQADIEPRRTSGPGDDVAVIDVEHFGIDIHFWVPPGEQVGLAPMCGSGPAVKQAGAGEGKGARADRNQPPAHRPQGGYQPWRRFAVHGRARDHDGIGSGQRVQPVLGREREAADRA